MATAKKLPSGSWRAIAYLGKDKNGKKIQKSFTAPTKTEAEEKATLCELTERKAVFIDDKDLTVGQAVELYIKKKRVEYEKGKISPTTVCGYETIMNNQIDEIKDIQAIKVNERILQTWIDDLYDDHSAKTVKNAYSLVHASLYEVLPRSTVLDWRITLPSMPKKAVRVPSEDEINTLLNYFKEHDYDMYIACILISFGTLRRSEICALTSDDIEGNVVHINKALLRDNTSGSMKWTVWTTKTELSTRDVILPDSVIALLPKSGQIVKTSPHKISDKFINTKKKLGIECTFHDLRHYSASIMHALGIADEYIMKRGGWSNETTLNNHYKGSISEFEKQSIDTLNSHLENTFLKAN